MLFVKACGVERRQKPFGVTKLFLRVRDRFDAVERELERFGMHWIEILVAVELVVLSGCGVRGIEVSRREEMLLGGKMVTQSAWPGVVWLESGCVATLVHPSILLYAGHCGEDNTRAWFGNSLDIDVDVDSEVLTLRNPSRYEHVDIERCRVHPESAIGRGTDFAYCELAEPMDDVVSIPPAVGCERESAAPGTSVTILGFGFASQDDDTAGAKRVGQAEVVGIGEYEEIVIGDSEVGTCRGDSGGPAFIDLSELGESRPDWRLLALLSSGIEGECGIGWYTDVSKMVTWLESDSGYDVTPCFDNEWSWHTDPNCRAPALDAAGEPLATTGYYSKSCGSPYSASCSIRARTKTESVGMRWLPCSIVILLLYRQSRSRG